MDTETKLSRFAKYAWFVLGYNLLVILWGVFLRASKSGDGCGQHWLTCHGEVIPSAPELKTVIEFSHRITSALDGFIVIALLIWAFRRRRAGNEPGRVLKMAAGSFVLVIIEGLLGAGLVLTGNTAETLTAARPFWMGAHLITTLVLLTFLTLTAWFASGGEQLRFNNAGKAKTLLIGGVIAFLLIGMSGSIAALTNLLFPSSSIGEGIAKDFAESSNILLRLRVLHPIVSVFGGLYLIFLALRLKGLRPDDLNVGYWSRVTTMLVIVQLGFGTLTLFLLGPIVMQVGHLLLADLIWISIVLLSANFLRQEASG
ncbi:MAG: COX15/CtaA family protein [Acidobacteria bacterium]|nr:COX15/CtaA family protein [Acidobacteriota bacterium]MBK8150993.1 COX15/CtaA family protein [Acidobacteriota bacterium]MBK8812797.1 COX15/CtaA family protein [Acidobacteriota bacterium]